MTQNPMEIALVVALVNDFTSIHDLANFRLVSKLWYEESLKKWRSNVYPRIYPAGIDTVIIEDDMYIPEVVDFFHKNPPLILLNDLLQLVKMKGEHIFNLSRYPYRNYRLEDWGRFKLLGSPSRREATWSHVFTHFFNDFGHLMHHLDLSSVFFNNMSELEDAIFKKTPNLKTLILGEYSCPDEKIKAFFQNQSLPFPPEEEQRNLKFLKLTRWEFSVCKDPWIILLRHFPNLENIILPEIQKDIVLIKISEIRHTYHYSARWKHFEIFLKAVKFLKNLNPKNLPMQSLDFPQLNESYYVGVTNLLRETNIPLKSLKIDHNPSDNYHYHHAKQLMEMFAETLTSLVIKGGCLYGRDLVTGWPFTKRMEYLQSLELIVGLSPKYSFLQYTPNLRKLRVVKCMLYGDSVNEVNLSMGEVRISSLREFHAVNFQASNNGDLKLIKSWMPNLGKLTMCLGNEELVEVCHLWKDTLKELKLLSGSDPNDEAIIGSAQDPMHSGEEWTNSTLASIRNLKYLRTFEMEHPHTALNSYSNNYGIYDPYCDHDFPRISAQAIKNAFLQLEHLQVLKLYVESEVKNEWLEKLKEKGIDYDIKVVNINNCRDTIPSKIDKRIK